MQVCSGDIMDEVDVAIRNIGIGEKMHYDYDVEFFDHETQTFCSNADQSVMTEGLNFFTF